jgi:subtilase family serine protease
VLLAALAGITPLTRDNLADADVMDQIFEAHRIQVPPVLVRYSPVVLHYGKRVSPATDPVSFDCQSNNDPQPLLCYGPYQIRQAYHVTNLLEQGITGKGSTITIIDTYGSPSIHQDLQVFDATWDLPNP